MREMSLIAILERPPLTEAEKESTRMNLIEIGVGEVAQAQSDANT